MQHQTNGKTEATVECFESTGRRLAEDVASLTRVRSRLSKTSDEKLHTIIPALIPKLFQRLENYSGLLTGDNSNNEQLSLDATTLSILEKARYQINRITCSAMGRFRGNESIPTDPIARAMLPFVDSDSAVVGTWALAFLQVSIQRTSVTNSSLISDLIPALLESIGRLHGRISQMAESPPANSPLEARWIRVSWLLFDCIVLDSGQEPMFDWDTETFDITRRNAIASDGDDNGSHDLSSFPALCQATRVIEANDQSTSDGFFCLLLDLLFFLPMHPVPGDNTTVLSRLGMHRMEHRNDLVPASIDEQEENVVFVPIAEEHEGGMQLQQRPVRPRRRREWSESNKAYLRYMKLVTLELAIWPPRRGFFQGVDNDRALLLSIFVANYESMHGRIAMSYLKEWKHKNSFVPLPVVASILVLMIGEAEASEVLDEFETKQGIKLPERLLGAKSKNKAICRPSMPWIVTSSAANALMEILIDLRDSTGMMNTSTNVDDEKHAILVIELSLKLSEMDDNRYTFLAIRLVSIFCNHIQQTTTILASNILGIVTKVLALLVDFGAGDESRTRTERGDRIPLGAPVPFSNRNDLNQLLQNHRESLKRERMKRDDALRAREDAYTLIPRLSSHVFERAETSPFRLPNLLLQCAVYEDRSLEHHAIEALDSMQAAYKQKLDKDGSLFGKGHEHYGMPLQQQATSLLPALLEAVCSGSVCVRTNAVRWIRRVLLAMDSEAASYLAAHLVRDDNRGIAVLAREILGITAANTLAVDVPGKMAVSFLNLAHSDGWATVRKEVEQRSRELARRLQMASCEKSAVLLLHNEFSVSKAESEYLNDRLSCLDRCGLVSENNFDAKEGGPKTIGCGICYDDVETEQTYSLPCGHAFCKPCWVSYARTGSDKALQGYVLDLRCPQHGCGVRVLPSDLRQLEPRLAPEWKDALLRRFVEEDPLHRYCPGPDCGCVARAPEPRPAVSTTRASLRVTCQSCATSFCFGCGRNDHAPASCEDMEKWSSIEGSSRYWIKNNSKPCPGCGVPIEKTTGCNHMRCTRCQTEFCWLCLSPLHSYLEAHVCSRYEASGAADDGFEKRALFAVTRYQAHGAAAGFAGNQMRNFDPERFLETFWFLEECDDPAATMARALEALVAGREFLKHSHVRMLFRNDGESARLQEDHHACLEVVVERLSRLTEINLHDHYARRGRTGIRLHVRKLAFYAVCVARYTERIARLE